MYRSFALVVIAFLAACNPPPVNRAPSPPLTAVDAVDLQKYAGLWYEIARLDNSFELGCEGVTAEYTPRLDGKITVRNTCRKAATDSSVEVADGVARVTNPPANSKLAVSFFGPFEGDYWVIGLAADYSWALVSEPGGRYLWILARRPQIPAGLKAELLQKLNAMGYNTNALVWPKQPAG